MDSQALVISEIALACVLLQARAARSQLPPLLDVDLGFRPERAATLRIDPAPLFDAGAAQCVLHRGAASVLQVPGFKQPAHRPIAVGRNRTGSCRQRSGVQKREYPEGFVRIVSDGYWGRWHQAGGSRDIPSAYKALSGCRNQ